MYLTDDDLKVLFTQGREEFDKLDIECLSELLRQAGDVWVSFRVHSDDVRVEWAFDNKPGVLTVYGAVQVEDFYRSKKLRLVGCHAERNGKHVGWVHGVIPVDKYKFDVFADELGDGAMYCVAEIRQAVIKRDVHSRRVVDVVVSDKFAEVVGTGDVIPLHLVEFVSDLKRDLFLELVAGATFRGFGANAYISNRGVRVVPVKFGSDVFTKAKYFDTYSDYVDWINAYHAEGMELSARIASDLSGVDLMDGYYKGLKRMEGEK